jgi:hypothetical protein
MRQLDATELDRLRRLTAGPGVEVAMFEVTATQLSKGIIDAHAGVRQAFKATGFHDYEAQEQGKQAKVVADLTLIAEAGVRQTTLSLYRPTTKFGDPRLWIGKLPIWSPETQPGDIFAIVQNGERCVGLNLSRTDVEGNETLAALDRTFPESGPDGVAAKLLERLVELAKAPIPAFKVGSTAVGHAVETALEISANSSPEPDYFGIELKSARNSGANRVNLFAKVADWSLSPIKSSSALAAAHGYPSRKGPLGRIDLNCSVTAVRANTQGLRLAVDFDAAHLNEVFCPATGNPELRLVWELEVLRSCLGTKHAETFWIHAEEVEVDGEIGFQLLDAVHTKEPNLSAMALLLADGTIQLDHLIKKMPGGETTERGPLFKIWPADLPTLFTIEGQYQLHP